MITTMPPTAPQQQTNTTSYSCNEFVPYSSSTPVDLCITDNLIWEYDPTNNVLKMLPLDGKSIYYITYNMGGQFNGSYYPVVHFPFSTNGHSSFFYYDPKYGVDFYFTNTGYTSNTYTMLQYGDMQNISSFQMQRVPNSSNENFIFYTGSLTVQQTDYPGDPNGTKAISFKLTLNKNEIDLSQP